MIIFTLILIILILYLFNIYLSENFANMDINKLKINNKNLYRKKRNVRKNIPKGYLTKSIRVRINPKKDGCIQFSQIAAYNETGKNLLEGKRAYFKSLFQNTTPSTTDGVLETKSYPNIYLDGTCLGNITKEFFIIHFNEPVYVTKVVLYNRKDCCKDRLSNLIVELLNRDNNIISSKSIESNDDIVELLFYK